MLEKIKIGPLPLKYYLPCLVIVLIAVYTNNLNTDIVGTFAFLLLMGYLFNFIGSRIPVFGSWMGGGILLPLFAGSALVYFHLIPETLQEQVSNLIGSGFINVFLGAIIVGSILSMDRKVLLNSTLRVLPCMLGAMLFVFVFLYLGCLVTGKSLLDGMFMVGLPNYTGGSSGAIAVVPQIYADIFNTSVGEYSAKFLVFMNISNLFCVIIAALLAKVGDKKPEWIGNGKLIKGLESEKSKKEAMSEDIVKNIHKLGAGLCISCCFLVLGKLCQAIVPQLNFIAWATILVVVAKAAGIMDDFTCTSTQYWQTCMVKNFLPFMITGIGIASLDLAQLMNYISLPNMIIILFGVIGSCVGALLLGKLFGFYPIEAMIVIGCNMGNLGGSGALTVLSTTNRMEMMPFAVIANRIGGAIMVILISVLVVLVV
jgi:malate:Na+ symporter